MRWGIIGLVLLATGCSKSEPERGREDPTAAESGGPDVGVTQVPGVALSYQYGFRLPVERIASVQEEHASQCETLTAVRCRIAGMTYDMGRNRMITASLQLKLAPEAARRFGKQGTDTVVKRGGMLASARIDSEESGAAMAAIDRDVGAITTERTQIGNQLLKPGLSSAERTQLQSRLAELSNEQRQLQVTRGEAALKLAGTPMTFNYESGDVDPGLSDGPILGAVKDGWANIVAGFAIILTILISILPWVATVGVLVWIWRRFGARSGLRHDSSEE